MKRAVEYRRVSTLDQHSSIENQEAIFKQWLEKNTEYEYYKSYEDEGISGAKSYLRVEWLKLIEDGKKGLFNAVVTKSFSRFGRNQRETLDAISQLRANNIRVIFLEDNLDSDKDTSTFGLWAWLAEKEANATSERIKMVWDSFNQEGKVHVTLAPYGYNYDKEIKNFVVNEIESNIVKDIFNMYLNGTGFNSIAQQLIDKNVSTKRGGKWAGATVRGILTNEFYLGTLVQGKSRTLDATMKESRKIDESEWFKHEGNHEALIEKDVFKKVNDQISERSRKAKNVYTKEHSNTSRNSNRSLFSNLLLCGECKSTMTIKRKKKDKYKPFYQCLEYDRLSLRCGHASNRINEDILVEIIKEELTNLSENNFEKLKNINIRKQNSKDNKKMEKEIKAIDKKLNEQIQMSNNLLMFFTQSKITESQFNLQNESISKSISSFMERKNKLEEELKKDTTKEEEQIIFTGIEAILNKPVEEWNNADLKEFIEKITIYIDGIIDIKVKYFN